MVRSKHDSMMHKTTSSVAFYKLGQIEVHTHNKPKINIEALIQFSFQFGEKYFSTWDPTKSHAPFLYTQNEWSICKNDLFVTIVKMICLKINK